jgi:Gpi18-like mannosyltransferase
MKNFSAPLKFAGIILLFMLGIIARGLLIGGISGDMIIAYIPWYDFLKLHGVHGIGSDFLGYTAPYTYLLWLSTLTSSFLPKVTAIKFICIIADAVNAVLVYRIVRIKYPNGLTALCAGSLFWILPTVTVNSSLWGQVDALYTLFILLCLYYLLTDRLLFGVAAFGMAFAVKAQAIFIAPVLAILFFKKRIAWWHFFAIPLVYILINTPAFLLGHSWLSILSVYSSQANTFQELSMNSPNLYLFMTTVPYKLGTIIGIVAAAALVGCWIWINSRSKLELNQNALLLTSFVSVALVPFVLPKMHDRYFYPADIFSLLTAFYMPELWFMPILYQIISSLTYMTYLLNAPILFTQTAAVLNTFTIGFLVWKQTRTLNYQSPITHDHLPLTYDHIL